MKSKTVEIGEAKDIDLETKRYIIHARGNPALEAVVIKDLRKRGWTQPDIATAMGLSQSQISKRESLIDNLIPELFTRLKKGEIRSSTAFNLSKLPAEKQKQYAPKKKITLKEVKEKRRNLTMSKDLISLLEAPIDLPSQDAQLPDPKRIGKRYRKKTHIFAVRMDHAFEVETVNGRVAGKAGDWLAKTEGDAFLYPIDATVFTTSYEEAPAEERK